MLRTVRIAIPDVPHPITQRGNNRQDVFFVDDDRRVYRSLLKEHSEKYGLAIPGVAGGIASRNADAMGVWNRAAGNQDFTDHARIAWNGIRIFRNERN